MDESFLMAAKLARSIRYIDDNESTSYLVEDYNLETIKDNLYLNGLEISDLTTPIISKELNLICDKFSISRQRVRAFVFSSNEIQASCVLGSRDECILRFTSSLIELLEKDEFGFVLGHELAHFLLQHNVTTQEQKGLGFYSRLRAQEISADRFGLLACGSIDVAIRTMMKIVSGLSSKHLRFDVGGFISQLNKKSEDSHFLTQFNTHPTILLRSRALLWFSLANKISSIESQEESLKKIDLRVRKELSKDSDKALKIKYSDSLESLKIWKTALAVLQIGSFSKKNQEVVNEIIGHSLTEKLKNFLKEEDSSTSLIEVQRRIDEIVKELEDLNSDEFKSDNKTIDDLIDRLIRNQ